MELLVNHNQEYFVIYREKGMFLYLKVENFNPPMLKAVYESFFCTNEEYKITIKEIEDFVFEEYKKLSFE